MIFFVNLRNIQKTYHEIYTCLCGCSFLIRIVFCIKLYNIELKLNHTLHRLTHSTLNLQQSGTHLPIYCTIERYPLAQRFSTFLYSRTTHSLKIFTCHLTIFFVIFLLINNVYLRLCFFL